MPEAEGLVLFLDMPQVVKVIHHHPSRLAQSPFRPIGCPIQLMERRSVREMKMSHRITVPRC